MSISASATVSKFLQERVEQHYIEILASRWRAVLIRLVKNTQAWQRCDATCGGNLISDIQKDFDLIGVLLDEEHQIYREGDVCLRLQPLDGDDEPGRVAALRRFLQGMLSCIALKEVIVAHWKECLVSIQPDTLRVYSHACIAHPQVRSEDVERMRALFTTRA